MGIPRGKCVWCGDGGLSTEDVVGKQFIDLLDPGKVVRVFGEHRGTEKDVMRLRLRKRVCTPCNNEWMARLDDACIALMGESMKSGRGITLAPTDQRLLAFWASKIALLAELAVEDEAEKLGKSAAYIPTDNFPYFYVHVEKRRVPPGTQVWIGATDGDVYPFWNQSGSFGLTIKPDEPVGYVSTFCVGQVLFQVLSHDIFSPRGSTQRLRTPPIAVPDEYRDVLIPIWKRHHFIVGWPPIGRVTARGLREVAEWPVRHSVGNPPPQPTD